MARADRLFDLIQILRDGAVHRAEDLARACGVSTRTVYRDMDKLVASGVPVTGARGTGYQITAQITLPPLNLTVEELEALHLGISVVNEVGDPELRAAAATLAGKLDTVLPEGGRMPDGGWGFAVFPFADSSNAFHLVPTIRHAVRSRTKLRLRYSLGDGSEAIHEVWPLNLEFWGKVWTCTAWSEPKKGFAVFRVDRILQLKSLDTQFPDEPGRRYEDYLTQVTAPAPQP